jgi:phage shock protein E
MDWLTWIIIDCAVAAFLVLIRLTLVSPQKAREWLDKGASVIDLRSEDEFKEGHLPGAVGVPLDQLRDASGWLATNKEQPLLLHSQTGIRSGMGKAMLRKMGYPNVFNLGSYGRAERILGSQIAVGRKI